jgi:hypothetical protein
MFFNTPFMFLFCFVFLFYILCILCYVLFLYCFMYCFSFCAVPFLFFDQSTDHCHRVDAQLQKISISIYHIISYHTQNAVSEVHLSTHLPPTNFETSDNFYDRQL